MEVWGFLRTFLHERLDRTLIKREKQRNFFLSPCQELSHTLQLFYDAFVHTSVLLHLHSLSPFAFTVRVGRRFLQAIISLEVHRKKRDGFSRRAI